MRIKHSTKPQETPIACAASDLSLGVVIHAIYNGITSEETKTVANSGHKKEGKIKINDGLVSTSRSILFCIGIVSLGTHYFLSCCRQSRPSRCTRQFTISSLNAQHIKTINKITKN